MEFTGNHNPHLILLPQVICCRKVIYTMIFVLWTITTYCLTSEVDSNKLLHYGEVKGHHTVEMKSLSRGNMQMVTNSSLDLKNGSVINSDREKDNLNKLYADDTVSNPRFLDDDGGKRSLSLARSRPHYISVNNTCINTADPVYFAYFSGGSHCHSLNNICHNNMSAIKPCTCLLPDSHSTIPVQELKVKDKSETKYFCDKTVSTVSIDKHQITSGGDNADDKSSKCLGVDHSTSVPQSAPDMERPGVWYEVNSNKEACPDPTFLNFTFVTGLFDLHRENWPHFQRNFDHYLNYSIQLLHMNVPLIIFVDPKAEAFVKQHREHKEHFTKLIVTSVEELEYYEDHDTIQHIMDSEEFQKDHAFIQHPEAFSPEYNILLNSKPSMLYRTSLENPFNSSHFFWIDMGYGHGEDIYPDECDWAPNNLMYNESVRDQITFIQLNPIAWLSSIFDVYKKRIPPFLNGGFFGGSIEAVKGYYNVHKEMYKLLLLHNMTDDDQTVAIVCYFHQRELFNLVDGWWYDAFTLFH